MNSSIHSFPFIIDHPRCVAWYYPLTASLNKQRSDVAIYTMITVVITDVSYSLCSLACGTARGSLISTRKSNCSKRRPPSSSSPHLCKIALPSRAVAKFYGSNSLTCYFAHQLLRHPPHLVQSVHSAEGPRDRNRLESIFIVSGLPSLASMNPKISSSHVFRLK